ncbi:MAG: phosphoribosylanthranilate isomerase [Chloroflexota bacterium]
MYRIKFCGLTSLEDALAAAECGADLLGFNFYPPSPRAITPQACAALLGGLHARLGRKVTSVGIFVNMPVKDVQAILDACGLDLAQLSGNEPPADLETLGERAFKALHPHPGQDLDCLSQTYRLRQSPPACLVDASAPGQYGGTGQTADWEQARKLAARQPVLLAGGLTPANVAQAAQAVRPWGVDVASGIESAPGKKDYHKMRAFVEAARSGF